MAFCRYCGKQLAEGQLCGCPQALAAQKAAAPQANTQAQQTGYPQMNTQPQQTGYPQMNTQPQQAGYPQMNTQPQQAGYTQVNVQPQQAGYTQANAQAQQTGYTQANAQAQQTGYPQMNTQAQAGSTYQAPNANGYQAQAGGYQAGTPQQTAAPKKSASNLGAEVKGLWASILDIFKNPAEQIPVFVEKGKWTGALGLIIVQVLISSFFKLVSQGTIVLRMGLWGFSLIFNVILSAGLTIVYAAIFCGLMVLLNFAVYKILGSKFDFKNALNATAVQSLYIAPLILLATFISIIFPNISGLLHYNGALISLTLFLAGCKAVKCENKTLHFYVTVGGYLIYFFVITLIRANLYFPM